MIISDEMVVNNNSKLIIDCSSW